VQSLLGDWADRSIEDCLHLRFSFPIFPEGSGSKLYIYIYIKNKNMGKIVVKVGSLTPSFKDLLRKMFACCKAFRVGLAMSYGNT
jgi:hypothetical protein